MNHEQEALQEPLRTRYPKEIHAYNGGDLVLLSGNSNLPFAHAVAAHIGLTLDEPVEYFKSGDPRIMIPHNIRNRNVVIMETGHPDPRGHFSDTLGMIQTAKLARANRIEVVNPLGFFTRQDRKSRPRESIMGAHALRLMQQSGADGFTQFDMHAPQLMGAVNVPVDNLFASHAYIPRILDWGIEDMVLVSPDSGGVGRVNKIADKITQTTGRRPDIAALLKDRDPETGKTTFKGLTMGDVKKRNCIVIDDMFDTCGTMTDAFSFLLERLEANEVNGAATHGIFSDGGLSRLYNSPVKRFLYTNTVDTPLPAEMSDKGEIVDVSEMMATAIWYNQIGESLSERFF